MSLVNISVLLVFVAFLVDSCLTLNCYDCNSVATSGCGDTFSSSGISTDSNCETCIKIKATSGDTKVVTRTCSPIKLSDEKCEEGEYAGVKGEVCFCNSNLCNSGTVLKFAPLMTVLFIVLSKIYNILY